MDVFYATLAVLVTGFIILGVFVLGMLFMKHIVHEEQQEARYDAMRYEYYRLAGVQKPTDPRPYVPPRPQTPRAHRILPGMDKLERLMQERKRGTIMWRAGDRKSAE
jgi:hypothetical protein